MLTIEKLKSLDPQNRKIATINEFIKCKKDYQYLIENYFTVDEPTLSSRVPFILYRDYQVNALKDFQNYRYNLTMKSRQMGFTTLSAAFVAAYMCTNKGKFISVVATKQFRSRKFLKHVRDFLDDAKKRAPWLVPDYMANDNGKDSFTLKNGCNIRAETNNEDACRGDTLHLLIIDEVATITKMDEIWSAAGITLTRSNGSCIGISTPKGQAGWYFEKYTNSEKEGWHIIDAHWSQHPIFSKGMYTFISQGNENKIKEIIEAYKIKPISKIPYNNGLLIFFNNTWPNTNHPDDLVKYKSRETYKYVCDGKLRSPWYDIESAKLGKEKTKCELDCSFAGSGGEVLDTEIVKIIELKAREIKPLNKKLSGWLKNYREYINYNHEHDYILAADVGTGDGSDYSAFVVIDLTTFEIAATYKEHLATNLYAEVINQIGKRFGYCEVAIEANNPGLAVLNELKIHLQYPKLFYSQIKKTDPTLKEKTKKLGFWQTNETRNLGGEKLVEKIESGELFINCMQIISELYTWVWRDGRRDHMPGKHDDLIMALTIAMYIIHYVNIQKEYRKNKAVESLRNISIERKMYKINKYDENI